MKLKMKDTNKFMLQLGNSPNSYLPVFCNICLPMIIFSSLLFVYAFTILLEHKPLFINFVYKCIYVSLEIMSNHVKKYPINTE